MGKVPTKKPVVKGAESTAKPKSRRAPRGTGEDRVVAAAATFFADHGFRAPTRELARRLGVTAVANSFAIPDAWIIDLGGGSAQCSSMRERRPVSVGSYPIGCVVLTERFLSRDPPTAAQIRAPLGKTRWGVQLRLRIGG